MKHLLVDLSASFQKIFLNILLNKLSKRFKNFLKIKGIHIKSVSVVGGVSNNKYIKIN